jgi:DNA ligase-1
VYQPARRGLSWVKLKRDYLEGLADSLDLVPIGAWRGNGRKVRWCLHTIALC